ncbi:MAG: cupin domain-containing protein [Oscillospiraceae bacterium]
MKNILIKNIPQETPISLAQQVEIMQGQVVSKTLAQNKAISITVFAFDKDEEISSHDSTGDAMVTILEGSGIFTVDGKEYVLNQGETLVMPAQKPHSVFAKEAFKMLLIVVFPTAI